MQTLFKNADDLVFAVLVAVATAGIVLTVQIDDGYPLVSSTDIVVTDPAKVDDLTPTQVSEPELYAARDTVHR